MNDRVHDGQERPLRTSTPNDQQQLMTMAPPNSTTGNGGGGPLLCCAQVRCENQMLRRALRKEREKRQFIGRAYQELLRSFDTLLDLKNAIDIPSPSISLSSADEQQHQVDHHNTFFPPVAAPTSSQHQNQNHMHPPPRPTQSPRRQQPQKMAAADLSIDENLFECQEDGGDDIAGQLSALTARTRTLTAQIAANNHRQPWLLEGENNHRNFGRTFVLPKSTTNIGTTTTTFEHMSRRQQQQNIQQTRKSDSSSVIAHQSAGAPPPHLRIPLPPRPPPMLTTTTSTTATASRTPHRAPLRVMNVGGVGTKGAGGKQPTEMSKGKKMAKGVAERKAPPIQLEDGNEEEDDDEMVEEELAKKRRGAADRPNWYFVSFDENNGGGGRDGRGGQQRRRHNQEAAEHHLRTLLARSRARCRAIADASRRRASMAANRRAVVTDLLKGKRQLDDEAMRVVHTDSTAISAFPRFMRRMRSASRRSFHKSPIRQQQEEERERLLERATNRILAHSSAAISKMLTKANPFHDRDSSDSS